MFCLIILVLFSHMKILQVSKVSSLVTGRHHKKSFHKIYLYSCGSKWVLRYLVFALRFYCQIWPSKLLPQERGVDSLLISARACSFRQLLGPNSLAESVMNRFLWGIGLRNWFSPCIVKFWSLEGVQRRELACPPPPIIIAVSTTILHQMSLA